MDAWQTNTATVSRPLTADELLANMREATRRLDAMFPRNERCHRIDASPGVYYNLQASLERVLVRHYPFRTIGGIDLNVSFEVPPKAWLAYMGDGSTVMHYHSGRKVRCLAEG